jgi:hypothetical protein
VAEIHERDHHDQHRRDPDDCVNHAPRYRNPGTTLRLLCNLLIYMHFSSHRGGWSAGS